MAVQYQNQVNLSSSYNLQDANYNMGYSDLLPIQKLVNKMASASIEKNSISYDLITENDKDDVIEMLKKTFFQDEPLNKFLELGECEDLKKYCIKYISENCSFKATNSDGEIIGVILNGVINKPASDEPCETLASTTTNDKFRKIMELMDVIDSKFSIFDFYPQIKSVLDGKIFSVDPNYRGLGIAGRLTDMTIEYMKKTNIKIFHVMCTSHFSARVLEKLDFKEVFSMPYADYVINDEQVFKPEKPHVAARIFVKEI